jgi:hypothetical protein
MPEATPATARFGELFVVAKPPMLGRLPVDSRLDNREPLELMELDIYLFLFRLFV